MSDAIKCEDYGYCGAKTPWIAHGGNSMIAGQVVINPATQSMGLVGEASFPYTVPTGKALYINNIYVENLWGIDIVMIVGNLTIAADLSNVDATNTIEGWTAGPFKVAADITDGLPFNHRNQTSEFNAGFWVPAGKTLQLWLRPNQGGPAGLWNYQWSIKGFLCNTTC